MANAETTTALDIKNRYLFKDLDIRTVLCIYISLYIASQIKVTVNVFCVKISIFRFLHILLAELSRHTMIHCLKLTEVLKMEEISCKRRFPEFFNQSFCLWSSKSIPKCLTC